MSKWITISKPEADLSTFYPISVIRSALKAEHISYKDAKGKDFSDRNVVLHCVWQENMYNSWNGLQNTIQNTAKNLWIEFDADNNLNDLSKFDIGKDSPLFFSSVFQHNDKFIWEPDMNFNPFIRDTTRLALRCYDVRFEKTMYAKDIDFFALIDHKQYNTFQTLELFNQLYKDGHKICVMFLNKARFDFYNKRLPYPVILNDKKFSKESIKRYEGVMRRSKVFVSTTSRLTTGRFAYDALFNNALGVVPESFGASKLLFPDYTVNTYALDLQDIYKKCKKALKDWSTDYISDMRRRAKETAGIDVFIERLRSLSNDR